MCRPPEPDVFGTLGVLRAEGGFFHVADPVFGAVRCVPGFQDLTKQY